jgi:triosephosphate isomerase (TIM)
MKKQKKLVVANWKMFPESPEEAKKIFSEVKRGTSKIRKTNVVICPSHVHTALFVGKTKSPLHLGSQDTNSLSSGSLTGEVSVSQLAKIGVEYVIIGHSERRKMGETDEMVNSKLKAVLNYGMTAVVCVGESVRDHQGDYLNVIRNQIISALKNVEKKYLSEVVVAYEPVWAIGAKEAMSPADVLETSIFIKKILKDLFVDYSESILILYGGSVDHVNASSLVNEGGVSGFLIGRQSLIPKDFVEIVKIVDKA